MLPLCKKKTRSSLWSVQLLRSTSPFNCSVQLLIQLLRSTAHSTAPFNCSLYCSVPLLIQLLRLCAHSTAPSISSTALFKWSLARPPTSWLIEVCCKFAELARGSMFDPFDYPLPPSVVALFTVKRYVG
ncbi:unnamed protein product [Macrosiphum euphorbiae]|nr:unnamed protein product [Macrosiphum euphorbiae]